MKKRYLPLGSVLGFYRDMGCAMQKQRLQNLCFSACMLSAKVGR